MKQIVSLALAGAAFLLTNTTEAQDRPKPLSPAATVSQTINTGATITINYSQPSLRGRAIGKDVEPMEGKIWRMGANNATTFETDKDVTVEGKQLAAGKYSLFGIREGNDYTLIFNREWKIWGTQYDQNKEKDALRVKATLATDKTPQEQLTYTISKEGKVQLSWGTMNISFVVQ